MDAFTLLIMFVFFMLGAVVTQIVTSLTKPASPAGGDKPAAAEEQPAMTDLNAVGLWIDPAQKVRLELDGKKVAPEEMTPEQRRRLIGLINLMRPWVEAGAVAPAQAPAPAAAPVAPPGVTAAAVVAAAQASADPQKPKINLVTSARDFVGGLIVKKEDVPLDSIVTLIDKFLQNKLANSPLANRGISLEEGPLGEVRVLVGGNRYNGIDAVPEPEIQGIIREAIAEWEKKAVR